MKAIFTTVMLVLAATLFSAPSHADTDQGLYMGVGLHETRLNASQIDQRETSIHATVGYRFNRFIGTEFGAYDFGNFSESAVVGANAGKAEFSGWAGGIAITGRLPFWVLDLYAKGGLAYYDVKSKVVTNLGTSKDHDTGTKLYGTLGGSVNIGTDWSVYLEWTRFNTSEKLDLVGLGFRYHFPQ